MMNRRLEPFITLIFHMEEIDLDFDQCFISLIIAAGWLCSALACQSLYAESRLEEDYNNLGFSFFNCRHGNRLSYISAQYTGTVKYGDKQTKNVLCTFCVKYTTLLSPSYS